MTTQSSPALFEDFQPLVKHDRDYVHIDSIATISAGYKREDGVPVVSRDGTIYISDPEERAPGLAAVLAKNGGKHLTIAVPTNHWKDFIQQTFRKESKTMLQAFGDANGITELIPVDGGKSPARRVFHPPGTDGFDKLKAECKVSTSISFILADYAEDGSIVYPFPDSVAMYRLRTTSEHTAENLISCLKMIAQLNHGNVAGIPITTRLSYPQKTTPNGTKSKAPVFVFAVKQPPGMLLTSKNLPQLAAGAAEAIGLSLPALPAPETIEDAIEEVSATKLNAMVTGLNPDKIRATFFAIVDGTPFDTDEARRAFMREYTNGGTESLATFLETATPESADDLLEALREKVEPAAVGPVVGADGVIDAEFEDVPPPDEVEVPVDLASPDEIKELWGVLVDGYGVEKAKDTLKDLLTHFGLKASAELTRAQVTTSIAHYRAHSGKAA